MFFSRGLFPPLTHNNVNLGSNSISNKAPGSKEASPEKEGFFALEYRGELSVFNCGPSWRGANFRKWIIIGLEEFAKIAQKQV